MTRIHFKALPETFESFGEARRNGFLAVKQLKDQGRGVVGTFCTYTPTEIFLAGGLTPVGLCATSDETVSEAEKTLPRNLCPLIKSSYGFVVTDKCPYAYFSDLIVGETTCDGKKKMYELLARHKTVHVMELPQTQNLIYAKKLWRSEILRLKNAVEELFELSISDEAISLAIKRRNVERKLLKDLYELSALSPPPMTGLQQLRILFGSQFKFNHTDKVEELKQLISNLKETAQTNQGPVPKTHKRIVITGCPMGGATEKVVEAIEGAGAVVVAFENCTGAKQYDRLVDETIEPISALTEYYLAIGCAVMSPNPNRFELLERLCHQFKADGVVEMTLTACQPYGVESASVREFLNERGIKFMSVETDYSSSDSELLKTRAAAFIETLS